MSTRQNNVRISAYVAFNKVTNGQTDIKHEKVSTLCWMPLLKIVVDKLPPSQRSRLESPVFTTKVAQDNKP